jgi:hypothetical protein
MYNYPDKHSYRKRRLVEYFELPDTCSPIGERTSEAKWLPFLSLSRLSAIWKLRNCVKRKCRRYICIINSTERDWHKIFQCESWRTLAPNPWRWDTLRETQLKTLNEWSNSDHANTIRFAHLWLLNCGLSLVTNESEWKSGRPAQRGTLSVSSSTQLENRPYRRAACEGSVFSPDEVLHVTIIYKLGT